MKSIFTCLLTGFVSTYEFPIARFKSLCLSGTLLVSSSHTGALYSEWTLTLCTLISFSVALQFTFAFDMYQNLSTEVWRFRVCLFTFLLWLPTASYHSFRQSCTHSAPAPVFSFPSACVSGMPWSAWHSEVPCLHVAVLRKLPTSHLSFEAQPFLCQGRILMFLTVLWESFQERW